MELNFLGLISSSLTWILLGSAVILFICKDLWKRSYWKRHGITSPPSIPIFGNSLQWTKGIQNAFIEYNKKFGNIFGVYEFSQPVLSVSDLDTLKDIMVKHFDSFCNRAVVPLASKDMGEALFMLQDLHWKNMRSVVTPTFSGAKMKHMSPLINECAGLLLKHIEKYQEKNGFIECKELFGGFVMDTIASCAFGLQVDSQGNPSDPFVTNAKKAASSDAFNNPIIFIVSIFPWLIPVFEYFNFYVIDQEATHFFADVVKKTMAARRSSTNKVDGKRIDYLQLLMDAQDIENTTTTTNSNKKAELGIHDDPDEDDKDEVEKSSKKIRLSEHELISQALIFFLAGYETTNTTSGFMAYLLARHPDVQDRLLDEINEIAPTAEDVGYNTISKMPYLDQVFTETMRIYPPAPLIDRICSKPFEINGFTVPKGMRVFIPIYSIHHDPNVWPDPAAFDPDRFSKENREKQHPFAWMPFGLGPRSCVGMRFAILEAKMAMVRVLQQYRLETCSQTEIPPKLGLKGFLSPPNGVTLRAVKRS